MFLGVTEFNFVNSFKFTILNKITLISVNFILFFRNNLTKQSLAVTITVSNKESLFLSKFNIITAGNLFILIYSRDKLFNYTKKATLGMVLEEPLGLSFEYSLPNKLFDYIHAGIPIVAGRLPEITSIIKEYNVGVIVKDYTPKEIAFTIQNLLNNPTLMHEIKENQKKVAPILCWEKESRKLDKYFI